MTSEETLRRGISSIEPSKASSVASLQRSGWSERATCEIPNHPTLCSHVLFENKPPSIRGDDSGSHGPWFSTLERTMVVESEALNVLPR